MQTAEGISVRGKLYLAACLCIIKSLSTNAIRGIPVTMIAERVVAAVTAVRIVGKTCAETKVSLIILDDNNFRGRFYEGIGMIVGTGLRNESLFGTTKCEQSC